jgi:hypothetical protein
VSRRSRFCPITSSRAGPSTGPRGR